MAFLVATFFSRLFQTPLHLAAAENNERIAKILVENGAKVDVKNADGETPADLTQSGRIKYLLAGALSFHY